MTTNRVLVSLALVVLVGAVALRLAWPGRTAPWGGVKSSTKVAASVRATAGTRTERSGSGHGMKAGRTPMISTRAEESVGAPADTVPGQVRCREVEAWAASGTEGGVAQAIAAAQAEPALRETVVRALGGGKSEAAQEYVAAALSDEDPAVLCAAIGAWAASKGEAAIPGIALVLEKNRARSDGWLFEVGLACVRAMGATRSSEALPVLEQELKWMSGRDPMLGYGAHLIEAVADIGDSRGARMLEWYADELRGKLAGDPLVRREQIVQMADATWKAAELR